MADHLYIVTYDISAPKRWREVYRTLQGFGEWLQLSVFQCRLSARRHAELVATLDTLIHHQADHVLIIDIGPSETVKPRVESLGKPFKPVSKAPVVV